MASLGDYVSNLILDSSRYTAGAQQGIVANKALSGSIESIIGQLERQKRVLATANTGTLSNILTAGSKDGKDDESKYALGLYEQVKALKELRQEENSRVESISRALTAEESLISALTRERAEFGLTAREVALYRAAQDGARDSTLRHAQSLILDIDSLKAQADATRVATEAKNASATAGVNLLQSLQRQIETYGMSADQIMLYKAAQDKVNPATIEGARSLLEKLNALRQATQHEKDAQVAANQSLEVERRKKQSVESLIESLERERREYRMSANQIELYNAQKNNATPQELLRIVHLQKQREAREAATEAEKKAESERAERLERVRARDAAATQAYNEQQLRESEKAEARRNEAINAGVAQAEADRANRLAQARARDQSALKAQTEADLRAQEVRERNRDAVSNMVAALGTEVRQLETSKNTYQMTANEIELYRAKKLGATQATLGTINSLQQERDTLMSLKQMQESVTQTTNHAAVAQGGFGRRSLILTESVRGLEDAVSGFSTNGLKGMLIGVTNNITQIGALYGGTIGLAAAVGGIAALIGASLIPMLYKWAYNTEEVTKRKKELAEASKKAAKEEMEREIELYNLRRDLEGRAEKFAADKRKARSTLELQEAKAVLKAQEQEQQQVIERERIRIAALGAQRPLNDRETRQKAIIEDISPLGRLGDMLFSGMGGESNLQQVQRLALERRNAEDRERKEEIVAAQRRIDEARRITLLGAKQQRELDIEIAKEKIRERARIADLLRDAEAELQAEADRDRQKMAQDQIAQQKAIMAQLEAQIGAFDPRFIEQQQLEARRAEIERAIESGAITDAQGRSLMSGLSMKPDPSVGNPSAVQFGSREAYAAILRAANMSKQESIQQEQKQILEDSKNILKEIRESVKKNEEVLGVFQF